jgi:hypothetical protein
MINNKFTWWLCDINDPAIDNEFNGCIKRIISDDMNRIALTRMFNDLYDGRMLHDGNNFAGLEYADSQGLDRNKFNFCANAVDFLHAKATAQVPAVKAVSVGADATQYTRTVQLSRFIAGALKELKYGDTLGPAMVLSALKTGTGIIKRMFQQGRSSLTEERHVMANLRGCIKYAL